MIELGTATSFSILAATGIRNVGPSALFGDIGVQSKGMIIGLTPAMVGGKAYMASTSASVAAIAWRDAHLAYTTLRTQTPSHQIRRGVISGRTTLKPGIYAAPMLQIGGTVILDSDGDPDATFAVSYTHLTLPTNREV